MAATFASYRSRGGVMPLHHRVKGNGTGIGIAGIGAAATAAASDSEEEEGEVRDDREPKLSPSISNSVAAAAVEAGGGVKKLASSAPPSPRRRRRRFEPSSSDRYNRSDSRDRRDVDRRYDNHNGGGAHYHNDGYRYDRDSENDRYDRDENDFRRKRSFRERGDSNRPPLRFSPPPSMDRPRFSPPPPKHSSRFASSSDRSIKHRFEPPSQPSTCKFEPPPNRSIPQLKPTSTPRFEPPPPPSPSPSCSSRSSMSCSTTSSSSRSEAATPLSLVQMSPYKSLSMSQPLTSPRAASIKHRFTAPKASLAKKEGDAKSYGSRKINEEKSKDSYVGSKSVVSAAIVAGAPPPPTTVTKAQASVPSALPAVSAPVSSETKAETASSQKHNNGDKCSAIATLPDEDAPMGESCSAPKTAFPSSSKEPQKIDNDSNGSTATDASRKEGKKGCYLSPAPSSFMTASTKTLSTPSATSESSEEMVLSSSASTESSSSAVVASDRKIKCLEPDMDMPPPPPAAQSSAYVTNSKQDSMHYERNQNEHTPSNPSHEITSSTNPSHPPPPSSLLYTKESHSLKNHQDTIEYKQAQSATDAEPPAPKNLASLSIPLHENAAQEFFSSSLRTVTVESDNANGIPAVPVFNSTEEKKDIEIAHSNHGFDTMPNENNNEHPEMPLPLMPPSPSPMKQKQDKRVPLKKRSSFEGLPFSSSSSLPGEQETVRPSSPYQFTDSTNGVSSSVGALPPKKRTGTPPLHLPPPSSLSSPSYGGFTTSAAEAVKNSPRRRMQKLDFSDNKDVHEDQPLSSPFETMTAEVQNDLSSPYIFNKYDFIKSKSRRKKRRLSPSFVMEDETGSQVHPLLEQQLHYMKEHGTLPKAVRKKLKRWEFLRFAPLELLQQPHELHTEKDDKMVLQQEEVGEHSFAMGPMLDRGNAALAIPSSSLDPLDQDKIKNRPYEKEDDFEWGDDVKTSLSVVKAESNEQETVQSQYLSADQESEVNQALNKEYTEEEAFNMEPSDDDAMSQDYTRKEKKKKMKKKKKSKKKKKKTKKSYSEKSEKNGAPPLAPTLSISEIQKDNEGKLAAKSFSLAVSNIEPAPKEVAVPLESKPAASNTIPSATTVDSTSSTPKLRLRLSLPKSQQQRKQGDEVKTSIEEKADNVLLSSHHASKATEDVKMMEASLATAISCVDTNDAPHASMVVSESPHSIHRDDDHDIIASNIDDVKPQYDHLAEPAKTVEDITLQNERNITDGKETLLDYNEKSNSYSSSSSSSSDDSDSDDSSTDEDEVQMWAEHMLLGKHNHGTQMMMLPLRPPCGLESEEEDNNFGDRTGKHVGWKRHSEMITFKTEMKKCQKQQQQLPQQTQESREKKKNKTKTAEEGYDQTENDKHVAATKKKQNGLTPILPKQIDKSVVSQKHLQRPSSLEPIKRKPGRPRKTVGKKKKKKTKKRVQQRHEWSDDDDSMELSLSSSSSSSSLPSFEDDSYSISSSDSVTSMSSPSSDESLFSEDDDDTDDDSDAIFNSESSDDEDFMRNVDRGTSSRKKKKFLKKKTAGRGNNSSHRGRKNQIRKSGKHSKSERHRRRRIGTSRLFAESASFSKDIATFQPSQQKDEKGTRNVPSFVKNGVPEAKPPTAEELRKILAEDLAVTNTSTQNWVRRSVRQPSRSVLHAKNVRTLVDKLHENDSDMVVLKLKKYLSDPDTPCVVIDAALTALERNTNCESLYIQNFNQGMRDEQVLHLLSVLQRPECRIWCLNIGETYNVKHKTWSKFTKGLKKTKITHMYASEHTITGEMKEKIRDTIRKNRSKHDMHINPENLDVIVQCTHCWWNPINAKALRPYLANKGYEHLLFDEVKQGLKGASSATDKDDI